MTVSSIKRCKQLNIVAICISYFFFFVFFNFIGLDQRLDQRPLWDNPVPVLPKVSNLNLLYILVRVCVSSHHSQTLCSFYNVSC